MKHIMPVKDDTDPILKAYFKVEEEVFPSKVEELYIKLANLVSDYFEYYGVLSKKQTDYDASFNIITSYGSKMMTLKAKIFVIEEQIRSIVSGQMSSSDVNLLHKLSSQLYPLKRNLETMQKQDNNNRKIVSSKNDEISSVHSLLMSIIDSIRDILKEIISLDINGVRRLDRIKVTNKHENEISEIFKFSKDYGDIFISYLHSSVDARIVAFNMIEAMADKIISLYNHNVLGEGFSIEETDRYKVADNIITSASLDNLINGRDVNDIEKLQSEDIPILNESTKFLTTGLINPQLIERYKTEVVSYNNRMLLKSLENGALRSYYI